MRIASLVFASITTLVASTPEHHGERDWSYSGEFGPENWGKISPICANGNRQTPINIETPVLEQLERDALNFHNYEKVVHASVFNNGHTIKVTPIFDAHYNNSYITVDGKFYKLLNFHMHTHSENVIDGKQSDLVAHLVHQSYNGDLAVVAVFFEESEENNMDIEKYWGTMPLKRGDRTEVSGVEISHILPNDTKHYYTFEGSLTTPPCTEGVKWFVLKDKLSISKAQIEALRKVYPHNFRPIQNKNGRKILER
jgi:carbonic anhydrase